MNAGVESGADEIEAALLGGGHVEHHVGMVAGELAELGRKHRACREP